MYNNQLYKSIISNRVYNNIRVSIRALFNNQLNNINIKIYVSTVNEKIERSLSHVIPQLVTCRVSQYLRLISQYELYVLICG